MHQKTGLCGLYVAVSNTELFIPDKSGSSVLMVGDEVLQCVWFIHSDVGESVQTM